MSNYVRFPRYVIGTHNTNAVANTVTTHNAPAALQYQANELHILRGINIAVAQNEPAANEFLLTFFGSVTLAIFYTANFSVAHPMPAVYFPFPGVLMEYDTVNIASPGSEGLSYNSTCTAATRAFRVVFHYEVIAVV